MKINKLEKEINISFRSVVNMMPRHKLKSFTFGDKEKTRNKRVLLKKKDMFWPITRGEGVYSAVIVVVAVVLAVAHVLCFCPIV